jgi:hypothetical protein
MHDFTTIDLELGAGHHGVFGVSGASDRGLQAGRQSPPSGLVRFDSNLRRKIEDYFSQKKLTLDVIAEVEDKATEIDLALKGVGLVLAMKSTVSHLLKEKSLIELASIKDLQEEVWLLIGKRKILNPLAIFAMKNFEIHR